MLTFLSSSSHPCFFKGLYFIFILVKSLLAVYSKQKMLSNQKRNPVRFCGWSKIIDDVLLDPVLVPKSSLH